MREIKFRGFSETQNRWLIGHYSIYDQRVHRIHFVDDCGFHKDCAVDGESIGQYTDMKNDKGVEIYEDDVIHVEGAGNYIVEWYEGGFITEFLGEPTEQYLNCNLFDYSKEGVIQCTVIGNRFQNPELLERDNEQS